MNLFRSTIPPILTVSCLLLVASASSQEAHPELALAAEQYQEEIAPMLKEYCVKCHGPEKQKGDFRVDALDPDLVAGFDGDHWEEVLNQLNGGDMPPEDEKQPSPAQRELITRWLTTELERGAELRASTGGRGVLRRLTRYDYNYTLQDLLGIDIDHARQMPEDRSGENGLQNNSSLLGITATQFEMYLEAAQVALEKALLSPEKPEVHSYRAELENQQYQASRASALGVVYRENDASLSTGAHYALGLENYPTEGRFRVSARVTPRPDAEGHFPTLQVWLGHWSDANREPRIKLGEMRIDQPRVVTFEGYMENVPLSASVREPGEQAQTSASGKTASRRELIIWISNDTPNKSEAAFGQITRRLQLERTALENLVRLAETKPHANAKLEFKRKRELKEAVEKAARYLKGITLEDMKLDAAKERIAKIDAGEKKLVTRYEALRPKQSEIQVDWVEYEGPYFESWPPKTRTQLLGREEDFASDAERVRTSLETFAARAWRRPVMESEVEKLVAVYDGYQEHGAEFESAIRDTFALVLSSPNFLYLIEPTGEDVGARPLDAYELASRLSYFLWSSLPDKKLRQLAASGELLEDAVISDQVTRMLADPKARRFATHFAEQWLGAGQIDGVDVNPEFFPRFQLATKEAMRQEPVEFFWHVLSTDQSALDFLSTDYVVVNQTLAKHYGIGEVHGSEFRAVPVPPGSHRGGLVTMAGFMLANSDGAVSHPIFRGKWLLNHILDDPPPPPPPGVPELDLADPDFAKLSPREQLAFHREKAACAQCHDQLDPWGLALENFDAIGQWRELSDEGPAQGAVEQVSQREDASPVDTSITLPDGSVVANTDELRQHLREQQRDVFAEGLTRKLLAYSLGRSLEWSDKVEVDRITDQFAKSNYRLDQLITAIVTSETFRKR